MDVFYNTQIKLLEPLFENKVVLHYPFFANTFPLAYHYSCLLNDKMPEKIHDLIKIHDWKESIPSLIKKSINNIHIHLFFATKKCETELTKDIFIENNMKPFFLNYKEIKFTKYIPRFIFFKFNVFWKTYFKMKEGFFEYDFDDPQQTEADALNKIPCLTSDTLHLINNSEYDRIEIYTDTPNEAKCIVELLDNMNTIKLEKEIIVLNENNNYVISPLKKKEYLLEIHFYSAPISMFLLNAKTDYIPFRLEKLEIPKDFETNLYIVYRADADPKITDDKLSLIADNLKKYNQNLFRTAKDDKSLALNDIFYVYNKNSRLRKQNSYFKNCHSYARCLSLHHDYSQDEEIKNGEANGPDTGRNNYTNNFKTNNEPNYHIHFGAGKLGIGLEIKIFKHYGKERTKILKLKKKKNSSIDWEKLKNIKYLKIKNSQNFECDFNFFIDGNNDDILNEVEKVWNSNDVFFCYSGELDKYKKLLSKAKSISFSVKDEKFQIEIVSILSKNKYNEKLYIFPFENKISPKLESLTNNNMLSLFKIKADRICTNRIFDKIDEGIIEVSCEKYGEVIFECPDQWIRSFFYDNTSGVNFIFAENSDIFIFFSERKKFLVNELHFIIALCGYHYLIEKGIDKKNWHDQLLPVIKDAISNNINYMSLINTFIGYEILRILITTKNEILCKVFETEEVDNDKIYLELKKYSDKVLVRIAESGNDFIKRVLNLDTSDINFKKNLENKYNEIIHNYALFMNQKKKDIMELRCVEKPFIGCLQQTKDDLSNIFQKVINYYR